MEKYYWRSMTPEEILLNILLYRILTEEVNSGTDVGKDITHYKSDKQ